MTTTAVDTRDVARFVAAYAKTHHAGAFATPLPDDVPDYDVIDRVTPLGRSVVLARRLTRASTRKDFTGRPHIIPAGAYVAFFVARADGAPVPDLDPFDYVFAYADDDVLTTTLAATRRAVDFTRISAASELIHCWGPPGAGPGRLAPVDRVTAAVLPDRVPVADLAADLTGVHGWHDDYPFYSDGSWSAVNLRGFRPDDPTWGVKPSEMPRKWRDEHPEAAHYRCGWTTLADRTPTIRSWVDGLGWAAGLERVRLLRMAGRDGKGGRLGRHTDITDRAAGTRDGQIARFHAPLITHPDIRMTVWPLDGRPRAIHLAPGHLYYLDARKPHAVDNPTGVDRIHLVIDVIVDEAVRERILSATEAQP